MLDPLKADATDSTPELIGQYIRDLTFQTAEIPRFVNRALVEWDKNNIVAALTGCILRAGGAQWSDVEFRTAENGLLEVIVTFNGNYDSTENEEETQLYGVRLSYSGIFCVHGALDDAVKKRCADIVKELMKDALFEFMRLSGFTSQMFANLRGR